MPLVKEARTAFSAMFAYTVGSAAGAAVTGGLLVPIAIALQSALSSAQRAGLVAAAASALWYADFRAPLFNTPSLRRQTCSTWYRRFGPGKTFLIWGFDLGLGFSTIRVSSLFWVLAIGVASAVRPESAPAVMLAYGVSLPTSLLLTLAWKGFSQSVGRSALGLAPTLRRISLVISVAFTAGLVAMLVNP